MSLQRIAHSPWLPYAVLVAACLAAYSNIYDNVFLFDDFTLIKNNKFLTHWGSIGQIFTSSTTAGSGGHDRFYRPLQIFSYLLLAQAFGVALIPYHLFNVALHCLNTCLGFCLGLKLGFRRNAAFAAMLLWGLHPLHTEAVTYMSGSADMLAALFILLGLISLTSWTAKRAAFACLCFILALLSKESAVIFPLLAMSLLFLQSDSRWSWRTYKKTWIFWCIALVYFALKLLALYSSNGQGLYHPDAVYDQNFLHRLYTFLASLTSYASLLLIPRHLHMKREFAVYVDLLIPRVIGGAILCLLMAAIVFLRPRQKATPLAWGVFWFAAAFLPTSGLFLAVNGIFYEHWMYLPSLGLILGLAATIDRALDQTPSYRTPLALAVAGLACLFAILTFNQNKIWREPLVFYSNMIADGSRAPEAHTNLGTYYYDKGDLDHAAEQFQIAIRNSPGYAPPYYDLAITRLRQDTSPASLEKIKNDLQKAIALNPDFLAPYPVLADLYAATGDPEKAAYYRKLSTPPQP